MEAIPNLVAVLFVVLANGFFVASEFALVTVRRSRLEQRIAEGSAAARAVRDAQQHLDTYIAAVQLGVTMASLALGWLGEPAVAAILETALAETPFLSPAARDFASHTLSVVLAFAIITTFHIVFGELVPKSMALQRTEAVAYFVVRPMGVFQWVFGMPIHLLKSLGNLVLKLMGLRPVGGDELVHSVDELRVLVAGSEAGVLDETEAEIVGRVLGFHELSVREVMLPRTELQALSTSASPRRGTALGGDQRALAVPRLRRRPRPCGRGALHQRPVRRPRARDARPVRTAPHRATGIRGA